MYPNLKLQLWKTGIRQVRMARLLNIDESMLSKIVNGFRKPSRELRHRVAKLLQENEEWLFEPMDSEPNQVGIRPLAQSPEEKGGRS